MKKNWFKNYDDLGITENRRMALAIANAGYDAIDTALVVSNFVKLDNNILTILDKSFDLSNFKRIKIVGFGKAAIPATLTLEKILGDKIHTGVVIGLHSVPSERIEIFQGTHPRPSLINIEPSKKIFEICDDSNEDDLIIAIVSGGGSALLCYPESEHLQGKLLYDVFSKHEHTIEKINTIRKHTSLLKGGGLAKSAYPATVIGLIFSDIPGDYFDYVASGPTYKDESTIAHAQAIIDEHNLPPFDLIETTKDDKYFEKVHNFVLVSNRTALLAMDAKAKEFGFDTHIVSTNLSEQVDETLKKIFEAQNENTVVLAAGEPMLEITKKGGSGGRNLFMALRALAMDLVDEHSVFASLASDGMDNSDSAGAFIDTHTKNKIKKLELDAVEHALRFDAYPIFEKSGDMIITGPTGANVSDLMILVTKKNTK